MDFNAALDLCAADLHDAEPVFRIGVVARAALVALGELPELEPGPDAPDWLPQATGRRTRAPGTGVRRRPSDGRPDNDPGAGARLVCPTLP
jgi:hypothetical protein